MNIPALFRKIFIPTLLGMLMVASITIIDGAFVGQGVGSDALAAVNIVAPFFLITTGVGLMFGTGASIVASIHLSRGQKKAARINITQAYLASTFIMLSIAIIVILFPESFARLMGSSDRLMPYVLDYMRWIIPALPFSLIMSIGMFIIRLDGSPKYAMYCNIIPGAANVVLDWLFIFPMGMGIEGAALATALAEVIGCIMVVIYMIWFPRQLNLYPLKTTAKSLRLTLRNIEYQAKLGASSMVGEFAIACMMFIGNYMFIRLLGEDGVAAFSVACYCFPLVFMLGNAIAQSAQPIISFNYGAGLHKRVSQTLRLSLTVAIASGILLTVGGVLEGSLIISLFIPNPSSAAYQIAINGFPYFSIAFFLFTLNIVCIGYLQSMEQFAPATIFMLLRGMLLVIPAFMLLPEILGIKGLWLAVPLSELLTLGSIIIYIVSNRRL